MTEKIKILEVGQYVGKNPDFIFYRFKREKNRYKPWFTIGINHRYMDQTYGKNGTLHTTLDYSIYTKYSYILGEHSINSKILDFLTNSDELIQNIGIEMLKIELKL